MRIIRLPSSQTSTALENVVSNCSTLSTKSSPSRAVHRHIYEYVECGDSDIIKIAYRETNANHGINYRRWKII